MSSKPCKDCGGKGETYDESRDDIGDDFWRKCKSCGGTGKDEEILKDD